MNLKPCPFCGKQVACLSNCEEMFCDTSDCETCTARQYSVVCDFTRGGCGACVGFEDTEKEAIDAWNRRANEPN